MRKKAEALAPAEDLRPISPEILAIARAIGRMMAEEDHEKMIKSREIKDADGHLCPLLQRTAEPSID